MTQETEMKTLAKLILITTGLLFSTSSFAQDDVRDATEELKLAAVEALIMAPAVIRISFARV